MPSVRFLDLVKPFTPLIPEVQVPETKVAFNQRIIWTSVTLVIFLVMSQMPLYGIVSSGAHTHGRYRARESSIDGDGRYFGPTLLAAYDDG